MQNPRDWPCCISVPETGGRFSRNRVATVNTLWISRRNRWKPVDHSPALASPISMIGEVGLPELHRQLTTGNWQLSSTTSRTSSPRLPAPARRVHSSRRDETSISSPYSRRKLRTPVHTFLAREPPYR